MTLEKGQTKKCVNALFAYVKQQEEEENKMNLLDEDTDVNLIISLKKMPEQARKKPIRLTIPHSLYADRGT
jgi:hypothetical protein